MNVEHIIEEDHAREMPDTLTIIWDVVQIADDIVAKSGEMTKEEIVQEMIRIGTTGRPALTYRIAMQRRGQRHHRQHGWLSLGFFMYFLTLIMVMYYYDIIRTLWYFYDIYVRTFYIISCALILFC